jgi:dCMP deaminase
MRPTIAEMLMQHALVTSLRGTCSRLQVGAVVADSRGVILTSGYNGSLPGMPHCVHTTDEPCTVASHAERNALYWAARRGIAVEGQQMYTTHAMCVECAKGIVQSGLHAVTYLWTYRDDSGLRLLRDAGVEVNRFQAADDRLSEALQREAMLVGVVVDGFKEDRDAAQHRGCLAVGLEGVT